MKKVLVIIACLLLAGSFLLVDRRQNYDGELLRFHVLANSDAPVDQDLKRKVRDGVLEFLGPKLTQAKTPSEAKMIVLANTDGVEEQARQVIAAEGFKFPVRTEVGRFSFPAKSYGDFVLPAGDYQAVRVIIGEGRGENWWCVLFPPLCFVDISSGSISHNSPAVEVVTDNNWDRRIPATVQFRWKIVDALNDSKQRISQALNL